MIQTYLRRAGSSVVACLLVIAPVVAAAEGISGYAEYNYSLLDSNTTDATGQTMTKSSSFNQRYSLTLDKNVFPTLRFTAVGGFEQNDTASDTNALSSNSESSRINVSSDLAYSNGAFNGGGGFSRRQETTKTGGASSSTIFFDSYNGRFGWRPEGLPTLDILYSAFNNYDEHYTVQDSTATTTTLSSRYKPHETVDLNYSANYSTLESRLNGMESQSLNQSLRAAYTDRFFKDRISLSTSYNIATQDTTIRSKTGFADEQVYKSADYYVRTDKIFPLTSPHTIDATTNPPPLIAIATAIPSDVVLTFNSSTAATPPAYSDHLGMQLSANNRPVNKIRVVVKTDPVNSPLSDELATLISSGWKVFSSSDGTLWNQVTLSGAFTRDRNFISQDGSQAIEANFQEIEVRYIKIVVTPAGILPLVTSVSSVTFARLEVFSTISIPSNGRSSSQISGLYNVNLKARLLNVPAIFYDFGYNLDHTSSDSQSFSYRYNVMNGLSLNHRFSPTLSTSARLAREDAVDPVTGSRSSSNASISLSAQPLPTLAQSLNYSFRQETDTGITKNTHSANLSNSAELYRGISLSLTGGGSMSSDSAGSDQKSLTVTAGLNMQPHRNLSINLSASDSRAWSSRTGKPESFSSTQTGDLAVTFNPLPNIYLFGSFTVNAQTSRKTQTTQSIGGSWSPFRGGALLLNTSYRESIDNSGNKDSAIVQSLRWNIRPGWYLDVSYLMSDDATATRTTSTDVFNTALRLSF